MDKKLLRAVKSGIGLCTDTLARMVGLSHRTVNSKLRQFERVGKLTSIYSDGKRSWYPENI